MESDHASLIAGAGRGEAFGRGDEAGSEQCAHRPDPALWGKAGWSLELPGRSCGEGSGALAGSPPPAKPGRAASDSCQRGLGVPPLRHNGPRLTQQCERARGAHGRAPNRVPYVPGEDAEPSKDPQKGSCPKRRGI